MLLNVKISASEICQ